MSIPSGLLFPQTFPDYCLKYYLIEVLQFCLGCQTRSRICSSFQSNPVPSSALQVSPSLCSPVSSWAEYGAERLSLAPNLSSWQLRTPGPHQGGKLLRPFLAMSGHYEMQFARLSSTAPTHQPCEIIFLPKGLSIFF